MNHFDRSSTDAPLEQVHTSSTVPLAPARRSSTRTKPGDGSSSVERSQAFADGVFAIAITLLVLEIHVPPVPVDQISTQLLPALWKISPDVINYTSSALLIGMYWVGHHRVFAAIKRHDIVLLWLNIAFLVGIGFLPFPSALLGSYGPENEVIIIYAACLFICGFLLNSIWWYAQRQQMADRSFDRQHITHSNLLIMSAPLLFLLTTVISFLRLEFATIIYFVVSYLYGQPRPRRRGRPRG